MMADKSTQPAAVLSPEELDKKVADLSYENSRSRLVEIVTRLEQGNIPLDEALTMWELGEALARRCESWLDGARERLRAAQAHVTEQTDTTAQPDTFEEADQ
ncbi:exodeoxyribonuclease VII small subunit [Trueperella bonasi]|uniref:Exodeoxyribonuclease 7 small subunit n=1 Tax=Trueperella bonasi TaxID=312286 RepID=A0ABT9NFC5_9ACTO|nr:exodeoxyribonuclease VII small subunit [Trueperella bonasi]MDP9806094.1 exodeoxyribonuclease VII small subunit [Trueperella bonasi]